MAAPVSSPAFPRLGLPDINLADSAVGVRMAALNGRYATLLPSVLGMSASWDPDAAFLYGSVIGRELRAQGYNMSIGGAWTLSASPATAATSSTPARTPSSPASWSASSPVASSPTTSWGH